jgi:D-sedoheptulose 7-phosphate isomerase
LHELSIAESVVRIVAERLADHAVVVRSDYIPRIQASIYHVLRGAVERSMA